MERRCMMENSIDRPFSFVGLFIISIYLVPSSMYSGAVRLTDWWSSRYLATPSVPLKGSLEKHAPSQTRFPGDTFNGTEGVCISIFLSGLLMDCCTFVSKKKRLDCTAHPPCMSREDWFVACTTANYCDDYWMMKWWTARLHYYIYICKSTVLTWFLRLQLLSQYSCAGA
jgi:hypothetical protein